MKWASTCRNIYKLLYNYILRYIVMLYTIEILLFQLLLNRNPWIYTWIYAYLYAHL